MRKSITWFFLGALATGIFSCATGALGSQAGDGEIHPASITTWERPESQPEKATVKILPLPVPCNDRIEALRGLHAYAVKLMTALKKDIREKLADHARNLKERTAHERATVESARRSGSSDKKDELVPDRTRSTNPPRPTITEPSVRPVVNTPAPESSSARNGQRTVYARQGDDIEIAFNEKGWLCLEVPPEGSGLEFVRRVVEGAKTLFTFRGRRIGTYELPFQYQDNTRGIMKRETIEIKVMEQKDFDAALGKKGDAQDRESRDRRRAYGRKLYELGNFKESLRELLASASDGDPELNHLIASLALREKDYKNAVLFWTKNKGEPGEYRDKAIAGLVQASDALGDRASLPGLARELLTVQSVPIEEELGLLLRSMGEFKDETLMADILNAYLLRYPAGGRLAEVYYLLGRLHEFTKAFRDFTKARENYGRVVKEFPESPYFAPARERIAYINRHYFKVQ
jgi:hypothetical protein